MNAADFLRRHPAPWAIVANPGSDDGILVDAREECLCVFDFASRPFYEGIVAVVNALASARAAVVIDIEASRPGRRK